MITVPVNILGGFLGAGKTTAVNHFLRQAGAGTVVIVNDFGAIDIDGEFIKTREGEVLSLTNGCVCCSSGSNFSAALARMLGRRPAPMRILIEASGVADPWRIAQLVKLERSAQLGAVVVLADALTFSEHAVDRWLGDTLSRQIARADIIALTKCDIALDDMKADARATITSMRPDVPIIETAHGRIPDAVMEVGAKSDASRLLADTPDHGFRSWSWSPPEPLDWDRLQVTLDSLPASVLRVKGIVRLRGQGSERQHVLQMVGRRWRLEDWGGPKLADRLVVIGTEALPDTNELDARFSHCLGVSGIE